MRLRLIDGLIEHAGGAPDAVALRQVETGREWRWAELERASAGVAAELGRALPAGAAVLLCAANEPEFVAGFLGVLRAGCKVFPLLPAATPKELTMAARQCQAAAVIGDQQVVGQLRTERGKDWPAILLSRIDSMREEKHSGTGNECDRDAALAGLLLHSSGTMGNPKIVHRGAAALDAVIDAMDVAIDFGPMDHVLAAVPLCHSYGVEHGLLAPIGAGSCVHLCRGFDLSVAPRELARNITIFPGVPSMFDALAHAGVDARNGFGNLRCVYSAGAFLPPSVAREFTGKYGAPVGQVYGTSEVGSVAYSDPSAADFDSDGVGKPMKGVRVNIFDADETGRGQVGIRAESMFEGYLREDGKVSPGDAVTDGYFLTGDLGRLDERGNLFITGRLKLLIDVGARKVNPLEVEGTIREHPEVGECVVVGISMSATVTRLKAIVTPRRGDAAQSEAALTPAALRQFAKARLSPHKVPRIFEIRDSLPHSAAGKILRHLVRE